MVYILNIFVCIFSCLFFCLVIYINPESCDKPPYFRKTGYIMFCHLTTELIINKLICGVKLWRFSAFRLLRFRFSAVFMTFPHFSADTVSISAVCRRLIRVITFTFYLCQVNFFTFLTIVNERRSYSKRE